jgi:radical SAM protein with 4Fe4S-binding SPASM domain
MDDESVMSTLYNDAPRIVIWEMTRACALACRHCRAEAIPHRNPGELSTTEAFALVDQVTRCSDPIFVLTGGDPLMRDDIYKIAEYATNKGLRVAVSPSATGRLRPEALEALSRAGCKRVSLSIDAPTAELHDAFRGVKGSFARTLDGARAVRKAGLQLQINTTVSHYNHTMLADFVPLLEPLDVALWSFFFIVPVGRAQMADVLTAPETEAAFGEIYRISQRVPFPIKTTEAPHYRRYAMQKAAAAPRGLTYPSVGDGKGFLFISHTGEICPSGFLPYVVGNVREDELLDVYRNHPIMQRLRAPETFGGKCGVCEFREICGGSRSRAYTMTGDAFASEPTCAYVPASLREKSHA